MIQQQLYQSIIYQICHMEFHLNRKCFNELMHTIFYHLGNAYTGPSVSGCTGTEAEKQIGLWERRMKGLRRMLLGWDQTKPPDPPYLIAIDVTGVNAVMVRVQESCDGPIATKFKGKIFLEITYH